MRGAGAHAQVSVLQVLSYLRLPADTASQASDDEEEKEKDLEDSIVLKRGG